MSDKNVDIQSLSPDAQLRGFAKTRILQNFLLSAMLHIVVLGATSVGFVIALATGAEDKPEEETTEQVDDEDEDVETDGDAELAGDKPDADGDESVAKGDVGKTDKTDGEAEREKSEYEKNLEDAADPTELPKGPGVLDLGDL